MLPRTAVLFAITVWGAAAEPAEWAKCCTCPQTVVCDRSTKFWRTCEGDGRPITVPLPPGKSCSYFSIEQGGTTAAERAFRGYVVTGVYDALHSAAATKETRRNAPNLFTEKYKKKAKGLNKAGYTDFVNIVAKNRYSQEVEAMRQTIDTPTCVYIPRGGLTGLKMEKKGDGKLQVGLAVSDVPDVPDVPDDIVKSYMTRLGLSGDGPKKLKMLRNQAELVKAYQEHYKDEDIAMANYDIVSRGGGDCFVLDGEGKHECPNGKCEGAVLVPEVQRRRVRGRSLRRLRTLLARVLKSG